MEVVPVINCADFACVKERLAGVEALGAPWVHFDIGDGVFASPKTWNDPRALITNYQLPISVSIEVHLMVAHAAEAVGEWLKAGAKRVIVHVEALDGPEGKTLQSIIEEASGRDAEVMLSLNPATPIEDLFPYLDLAYEVQCLAVPPGPSGQPFDRRVVEKVALLRARRSELLIEVDGGINLETARLVRAAGADIVTSGSYIWTSRDPLAAYRELCEV